MVKKNKQDIVLIPRRDIGQSTAEDIAIFIEVWNICMKKSKIQDYAPRGFGERILSIISMDNIIGESESIETLNNKDLMEEVEVYEIIAFLIFLCEKEKIKYKDNDELYSIIKLCVKQYKLNQIFYFIWMTVKDVASSIQSNPYTKKSIINSIPKKIKIKYDYFLNKEINNIVNTCYNYRTSELYNYLNTHTK